MKCACCDKELSETEVVWNNDCGCWEYCTTCLLEIADVFSDPLTEDEIDQALLEEWGGYLDAND